MKTLLLRSIAILQISFLIFGVVKSQVVRTEPAFPSQLDDIILYFDAGAGNAALKGFSGEVYAHTGVITSQSVNGNDWKHVVGNWGTADSRTLMTKISDDIYSLTFNINDFYGILPGEQVLKLAFVFRNVDGSIVGRDSDGSDIFYDIYPEDQSLLLTIFSPATPGAIYIENDSVLIDLQLNDTALVSITDNGTGIYTNTAIEVQFQYVPNGKGLHQLEITASADTIISLSTHFFVLEKNPAKKDPPLGLKNGLNYYSDSSYIFQLFAPLKTSVFLLCPANNYNVAESYQLTQSTDGNTWWIELSQDIFTSGKNTYQYLIDGNIRIADPFAEVVLDPVHDPFIDQTLRSQLPPYPEGMTSGIVTAFDLEKSNFDFQIDNFAKPPKDQLVIYELLIRDFIQDHSFRTLIDTLAYFEKLGINAIELMPVAEFEGNISWGYSPSFHMAVDKYYGSRTDLKALVDAAHARGIAIILDVVYNHAFSQSPLVQLYWDAENFRPSAESPYLNVVPRHPFNVGYDFNHESIATKSWVKQTLSYWIDEFKVDGFRFDLSKGLTQFNSGDNAALMSRYDPGRIAILKDYAEHIWSHDSTSYVILEHFADNDEEIELSNYGTMLWGNMNHQFIEASKGFSSDLEGLDYTYRNWTNPHLVGYMESHDEERMIYRTLREGDREGDYNTRTLKTALKRMEAASSIFYLVPGPKMFWQFGELGYDFSINHCIDGTVRNECRLDPKPIRWDYLSDIDRKHLQQVNAALIHLKTTYPTFSTNDFVFNDGNLFVKSIVFNHPDMDALAVANFRVVNSDFIPKFPYTGLWYEYFSGDSLLVENINERITFLPGEYRLYTSKRISLPDDFVTSAKTFNHQTIDLYPNVVHADQAIELDLPAIHKKREVRFFDSMGRQIDVPLKEFKDRLNFSIPGTLPNGMYLIQILSDDNLFTGKFIKQ